MRRARMLWATGFAAGLSAVLFVAVANHPPRPRLIWNASASAPLGLYRVIATQAPKQGDLVAIQPPGRLAAFLAERHYLARGVPMLKHVAAAPGARLCRKGRRVSLDGRLVALALRQDSRGRSLPLWHGCHRLGGDELFLLNPATDSMDGRYFGAIPSAGLLGTAIPLLTRDTPAAPLVWRVWGSVHPLPGKPKG